MTTKATLYYIHDPMCSWCWAFKKTWASLVDSLPTTIQIEYLVGGLAPDSNEPMPKEMQNAIAGYWEVIQQKVPGTEFNFDFWEKTTPRRSTYPACRAVVAVKHINKEKEQDMINAIQEAYYLKAENPSDVETLINCAERIGVNKDSFSQALSSDETNQAFLKQISTARSMHVNSFPSLVLKVEDTISPVFIDYNDADAILNQIRDALSSFD